MLAQATMTSKGQTTIPKEIRDSLGLQSQDKLHFALLSDGTVIMRAKKRSIESLAGILHKADSIPISIEEMQRP
ncbi:MAG: type II toxin-antitoxin system PrlF family antitoxin [Methylotenera sp.]|jgi:AbrB family looped-hinge helix DNA binding protein|uniref:AbrB/MazE/SpoVT family DNA-binding domain-containing protein n=1 Tax=Methylotenera sp. TaxID=2051956 RepID=UPI0027189286|nr:type II toxin-antitoxin system PrlF family antitoxin [Methylotenera sp.]MDO9206584.1 type II toxin-antitoxin system PrlF family antitoxin [Methylotenera sp.]MDO9394096.1 type II toxin-antitoxin system PrlF family antitoxin [Methylotenera sp.]MDP2231633.1 type II toxin-antitoxin system PrlF family antitoxin [Methylotenera sp.]MDP3140839.1 type II toxin-antitoxin system PrlF family antitoxin [Methylotenera sp.]MDP3307901.1 type II toxin-antitoxin system PrlF family antitoxin [Methylotenera sp